MEEEEEVNDNTKNEFISNIDADFCSLYYKAVKRLLDIDNKANVSYLYRYTNIYYKYYDILSEVRKGLKKNENILELLESSFYYRLIYFYQNATLLSSVVAFHFQNVYKQDPNLIKILSHKKIVKICSIGGRSVPGVVATIRVLKSIALEIGFELDFRVTIIDKSEDWKNVCITVLSCLEEFNKATWKINLVQCNLGKTWTPEILKTIQEADIILMVRFISNVGIKRNIVKVVSANLQTEGIFIILDHPYAKFIRLYFDITNLGDFCLLHAELCDYHTLDIEVVKQFKALYKEHFVVGKPLKCNVSCNMFVSVWIKVLSEKDVKYKDNIECIFQTNTEKYNPNFGFLCNNALTKWGNLFKKNKEADGWSAKGIKKIMKNQKEKRCNMFGKYIHLRKGVDSFKNHLLTELQWLEIDRKEYNEINNKCLNDYLSQKSQFSLMKKKAYFASLSAHNLSSFFE